MKNIKQTINTFEKQLVQTKRQIKQHNKSLLDYACVLKKYAQYLFDTQVIAYETKAIQLAQKSIRCYRWMYFINSKKFESSYAKVLVEWFDYMNLDEHYEIGIALAEKAMHFYQPRLKKNSTQYLTAYAKLLSNYGYCLWMDDQITKAQQVLLNCINIYKPLLQNDSTHLLAYCQAQHNYVLCLPDGHEEQACEIMASCLALLEQATNQQSLAFKIQKANCLDLYISVLRDDLLALALSEQLVVLYQELTHIHFKTYAWSYANFLMRYAHLCEMNVWTGDYEGRYQDSPRLALADKMLAESVELHAQLFAANALYDDSDYLDALKCYIKFLLEQEHPDRTLIFAKKAHDFAKKMRQKENTTLSVHTLNYARTCDLYAQTLEENGEIKKALKMGLESLFWYEQFTLIDPYYLEDIDWGIYEPEDYTHALERTVYCLDILDHCQQALIYDEKAYRLAKRRYTQDPSYSNFSLYLKILNDYSNLLGGNGQTQKALVYSNRLLDMLVKHYQIKKYRRTLPDLLVSAYGNNAYILASNQHYEEALDQVKKALSYIGLTWYDSTGFKQDKAWLLNNLGTYQAELGEAERGLKNAEKSLAIRLQLFKKKPSVFLTKLQRSHVNCACILTDLGRFDEALAHYEQIIKLDKTHKIKPSCFDQHELVYLNWLIGGKIKPLEIVNAANEEMEPRDQQALNFHQYWVLTCLTPSDDHLIRALHYFLQMDQDIQDDFLGNLVVLMCLLQQHQCTQPKSLEALENWQADYQLYIKRRKGRIPQWIVTTAEKLGCTLPAIRAC